MQNRIFYFGLLSLLVLGLIWSLIAPHDYFTWFLEVFPIFIALPILLATHQKFPLTKLLYSLILIHAVILLVGGHYTYAEVPLFNWLRDVLHLDRNYYDRVGHFAQGAVPAIIAREILIRNKVIASKNHAGWLFFIVCCICLSISAMYEFVEWWVAVATGEAADAFLGTQGDVWDTQWDMLMALIGAIVAQCGLRKMHDKQLLKIQVHVD